MALSIFFNSKSQSLTMAYHAPQNPASHYAGGWGLARALWAWRATAVQGRLTGWRLHMTITLHNRIAPSVRIQLLDTQLVLENWLVWGQKTHTHFDVRNGAKKKINHNQRNPKLNVPQAEVIISHYLNLVLLILHKPAKQYHPNSPKWLTRKVTTCLGLPGTSPS